jgi:hypothetical protein
MISKGQPGENGFSESLPFSLRFAISIAEKFLDKDLFVLFNVS